MQTRDAPASRDPGLALALVSLHLETTIDDARLGMATEAPAKELQMTEARKPEGQILRTRIRFALRRATGVVFDIDAMLRRPEHRALRIRLWRDVGSHELSSLLDELETEFQADGVAAEADASPAVHAR
ncbi:hypothetical protein [Scleromatobacter humisilvae]|uniref:Uncharacterized protein n=1 Tax=Scleromatobacter humisilvae TaxID=2897159 RepID=A0A9X1YHA0_9BURK|nr:hypothetical protein [Scleromatobacter humisilvae]MCK9684382.1 hypothetical protein [Scleromatobacter humisilvae]